MCICQSVSMSYIYVQLCLCPGGVYFICVQLSGWSLSRPYPSRGACALIRYIFLSIPVSTSGMALLRTSSVNLGRPGAKALSTKCLFVETSAKTGAGVQSLFTKVCVAGFFCRCITRTAKHTNLKGRRQPDNPCILSTSALKRHQNKCALLSRFSISQL